jgi:capsular polysaccharide transport system permease protein
VSLAAQRTPSLLPLLRIQGRVIGALILREMIARFGRRGGGFLWLFLEPLLFMALIGGFRFVIFHETLRHDIPIVVFAFVSLLPFLMFRHILSQSVGAVVQNSGLLYHRQVTVLDVLLARNLLEVSVTVALALVGLVLCGLYLGEWPADPLLFAVALLMSALLANGIGMLFGALGAVFTPARRVVGPLTLVILPLSGAMWLMQDMPPAFRAWAEWIPMVSLHEAMRDAQFGSRIVSYHDLGYVLWWALGATLVGLAAVRAVSGLARSQ